MNVGVWLYPKTEVVGVHLFEENQNEWKHE